MEGDESSSFVDTTTTSHGVDETMTTASEETRESGAPENSSVEGRTESSSSSSSSSSLALVIKTEWELTWEKVRGNPLDFSSWTRLVTIAESEDNLAKMREASEGFLAEFPLLFGYWKKYAEFEFKHDTTESSRWTEIYERGCSFVRFTADLWSFYCSSVVERCPDADFVRSVFDRALEHAGRDFLSHPLWDKYLEFESSKENLVGIVSVLRRALQFPLKMSEKYYERLSTLVEEHLTRNLVSDEEFVEIERLASENRESNEDEVSEGARKEILFGPYRERFLEIKSLCDERDRFESRIKPTFFNVATVDEGQLENWRAYILWCESKNDFDQTVNIYERCLIPCCLYLEFWNRYARFLERSNEVDKAREVLKRGAEIFLKHRPAMHILRAAFEEMLGNLDEARTIYELLIHRVAPQHIESVLRFANFERRVGNLDACGDIFRIAFESFDQTHLTFLAIKYADFLEYNKRDIDSARSVYRTCLERTSPNAAFWYAFISFEVRNSRSVTRDSVANLFEEALGENSGLTDSEKKKLGSYQLEFSLSFGSDVRFLLDREFLLTYGERDSSRLSTALSGTGKREREDEGLGEKMPRYNSYNSHSVTAAVHQPAASYNTGYSYPVAPPPPVQPAAPSYYGNPPSSGYSYYGSGYGQAPIPPPSVPAYGQTYPPSYSNYYNAYGSTPQSGSYGGAASLPAYSQSAYGTQPGYPPSYGYGGGY